MNALEVCTDASLKTYDNGRVFTCAGAICLNNMEERYYVDADSTNNRGELLGIYLGVRMIHEELMTNPVYDKLVIYSDSQFGIFGIRDWMNSWLIHQDAHGTLYGTNKKPVINQELFKMIVSYCITNRLPIHFYHQRGHVNTNSSKKLANANRDFHTSNGFVLRPENIFKISFYNDIVDKNSRQVLEGINPDMFPLRNINEQNEICRYIIDMKLYKKYILR